MPASVGSSTSSIALSSTISSEVSESAADDKLVATSPLVTDAQAQDRFETVANATFVDANGKTRPIAWNYGTDYCFYRAAQACDDLSKKYGDTCGKEFIVSTDAACTGNLSFQTPDVPDAPPGKAPASGDTWGYHTAARGTEVSPETGSQVAVVYDKATQNKAVSAMDWALKITPPGTHIEVKTNAEIRNLLSANHGQLPCGHTYLWEAPGDQVFPTADFDDTNPSYAMSIEQEDLKAYTAAADTGDTEALAGELRLLEASDQPLTAAAIKSTAALATPAARDVFATQFPNLLGDLATALSNAAAASGSVSQVVQPSDVAAIIKSAG